MGYINEFMEQCKKHQIPKGCSRYNVEILSNMNEIYSINARNSAMLYFCLYRLKIEDVRPMYVSVMKQKEFYNAFRTFLKINKIDADWIEKIKYDIKNIYNRQNHIWLITRENIYLTEYYPYFQEVGFEKLLDFNMSTCNVDEQLQSIIDDYESWKKDNQDKIDAHVEKISVEIQARDELRRKKAEEKKAEKEAKRLAKKKADDEVKEIRKNNLKHLSRERMIRRSFERYYN